MMLRRVRDWWRVIGPLHYLVVLVPVICGGLILIAGIRTELGRRNAWELGLEQVQVVVLIFTAGYAMIRALCFNPLQNRAYRTWLINTPWHYPQELPLGPARLVWQDAAVVAVLTLIFPTTLFPSAVVPIAFLAFHSLTLSLSLCRARSFWTAYGVLFLLGCMILSADSTWTTMMVSALMYGVADSGTREMLRKLTLDYETLFARSTTEPTGISRALMTTGWPVAPASPDRWSLHVPRLHAALISATLGWLVFCVAEQVQIMDDFEQKAYEALTAMILIPLAMRIAIYVFGFVPPISLLGRLKTGRLIIPGYDVVLVGPAAVAIVLYLLQAVARGWNMDPVFAMPVIATICCYLTLALPPSLETWQLTGHHRIAYRFRSAMLEPSGSGRKQSQV